ncbi:murein biosynthesis integral membrane protein MurJ [Corynebacterium lubricantis]|uniref:murein biosynthesis integral membrane protein MurJ n=1 Tax=Corynebacterium lubricantis TaxID=541095 RepID=UPI000477366C|nr:murein biosynthesis integral membrane protein MurJ [Corynebacterium lubricantis]
MGEPPSTGQPSGQRRRIVTPSPPAPVPAPRRSLVTAAAPAADRSTLTVSPSGVDTNGHSDVPGNNTGNESGQNSSDETVVRDTGSMAIATLISRITGFIRTVMITSMLGGAIASAFNLANTLPNMITEVVLGSVLTALVVPVLVRAEKEDPDKGARFIRQLFTLTLTLLLGVTVLATAGAPVLVRMMMDEEAATNYTQATSFAYLLLPQIFFYGLFSLFMAILNTKGVFKPGAWAPVVNNLISITVLAAYRLVPGSLNPAAPSSISDPHVLLLGLGTTFGVVMQCLIMLPSLKRLKIDLRPLWGIDDRLKEFGGMALAIVAYVLISQLGYVFTARIANNADASAYAIYQQHWQLLQVPYGIIGVTLLTAIMPRLSRNAADGDDKAVVRDLTLATKLTFIALIPIIIFMTALGPDIGNALFGYGAFTTEEARILGRTISFSAFTLIPYALVMLHLRVFYAREDAWTPTFIIAGITVTKVFLSYLAPVVASSSENVVILLGAANGFGFIAGALIGAFLLKRKLGNLQSGTIMHTSLWAAASSLVGIAAGLLVRWLMRASSFGPVDIVTSMGMRDSLGILIEIAIEGIVFLIVTGIVLSRSGLPEVQNLGRVFARIPVIGKFIRPNEDNVIETGTTDPTEMSQQFLASDTFNASPVPPPMSAGVVRGPRLVAGAPVSDGRFRLLRDHGSVSGAQFWQAKEIKTGRTVALTFVDTQGQAPMAPVSADEAARISRDVARRTRQLGALHHEAVAPNIQVLAYRAGCLVVADWIPGSSLKAVAESEADLHPEAVAIAMAPLADALAEAHDNDALLGLDNRNRLRVSVDGEVVLAFPAVLPTSSQKGDASSFASALELLDTATGDINSDELDDITARARKLSDDIANPETDNPDSQRYRDLATDLRAFSKADAAVADQQEEVESTGQTPHGDDFNEFEDSSTSVVPVVKDETPNPASVSGFGSRGYTPRGFALLIALAVAVVVLIAALTTYLVGFVGGGSSQSPVNQESVEGDASDMETSTARPLPVVVNLQQANTWQAPGQDQSSDNPGDTSNVIDGDTSTTWSTDAYPNGLGTKPGIGLIVEPQRAMELQHIEIDTTTTGVSYNIYALPAGQETNRDTTPLESLPLISDGTLRSSSNSIEIDSQPDITGVVIWFTDIPTDKGGVAEISEVSLIGIPE